MHTFLLQVSSISNFYFGRLRKLRSYMVDVWKIRELSGAATEIRTGYRSPPPYNDWNCFKKKKKMCKKDTKIRKRSKGKDLKGKETWKQTSTTPLPHSLSHFIILSCFPQFTASFLSVTKPLLRHCLKFNEYCAGQNLEPSPKLDTEVAYYTSIFLNYMNLHLTLKSIFSLT